MFQIIGNTETLTHDEWLSLRCIGGSDVGTILGYSHFKSPYQLWLEHTTGERENIDNKHTRFGKLIEPVLRDWFASEIALDLPDSITEVGADTNVYRSTIHPFITGNIDGYVKIDGELGVIECKTASIYNRDFDDGNIPDAYYAQIQLYLWLLGRQFAYIVWLRDKEMDYQRIDRNEDFIEMMLIKLQRFWYVNVEGNIPPEMTGEKSEEELLVERYKVSDIGKIVELPELEPTVLELRLIKDEIKRLTTEKTKLENEIRFLMEDAEVAVVSADITVTWRANKVGNRILTV